MAELSVHGIGVATADPELRFIGEGKTAVCVVNLAFNRSFKSKGSDDWKQETCFIRAQTWGVRAETMNKLVKKGQPISISGSLKQDRWDDKEGQKKVAYTINVRDFELCVKGKRKRVMTLSR